MAPEIKLAFLGFGIIILAIAAGMLSRVAGKKMAFWALVALPFMVVLVPGTFFAISQLLWEIVALLLGFVGIHLPT